MKNKGDKTIVLVGATTGGGVATINNLIIDYFNKNKISFYLIDKSKISSLNKFLHYLIYYGRLFILLLRKRNRIKFVLIHLAEGVYSYQIALFIISKLFGIKNVAYYHGQPHLDYLDKKVFKLTNKFIDIIFAISKVSLGEFIKLGRTKHTFYTPNFVSKSLKDFEDKDLKKEGFLYLGRMEKSKGIYKILDLAEQFPNQKFKFVGNFENVNEKLNFINRINKLKNVEWLGAIYSNEKYKVIQESKVLLFFTDRDCFPLTLLECGYFAVPAIVTATGAIPEFISNEKNGILLESSDMAQIAYVFNKVISQESLISRMGNSIRSDVHKYYTSEVNVKKLLDKTEQVFY